MNTLATRIILIWSALLLTGCIYQNVDTSDIESAIIICASKGANVVSISSYSFGTEEVTCSNRLTYAIGGHNLPKGKMQNVY